MKQYEITDETSVQLTAGEARDLERGEIHWQDVLPDLFKEKQRLERGDLVTDEYGSFVVTHFDKEDVILIGLEGGRHDIKGGLYARKASILRKVKAWTRPS